MIKLFILILNFLFCSYNDTLLSYMNQEGPWIYNETQDGLDIYDLDNEDYPVIKVEGEFQYSLQDLLDVIMDLDGYNEVISNSNVYTEFISSESDTLYGYQKVSNFIPFVRNRHIIFKLYKVGDNKIEWKLINKDNSLYHSYKHRRIKELSLGAGSWEVVEQDNGIVKLIHYMYIDADINLPDFILNTAQKRSVVDIFNDVLNAIERKKR